MGVITHGVGEGLSGLGEASKAAGGWTVDKLAEISGRRSLLNPLGLTIPAEASAAVGTALETGIPALVGGTGGAALGRPAMEAGAKRVMQSALKPSSKSLANGDAAKAIQTMLDEGISATAGGAAKLRLAINKLRGEVAKEISAHPSALVDKAHIYKELQSTLDDVSKLAQPDAPRAAVLKAWENFKNHPLAMGESTPIPVGLADEMKRATQKSVRDAYGRLTQNPIDDKIDMAMATGLRKGVESVVPNVGPMNAKISQYVRALEEIEPRVAQEANKQIGGLVPLAHSPEGVMAMLADRNPWMKSAIARVLYSGRNVVPASAGGIAATQE
jgi:hypothetical protein